MKRPNCGIYKIENTQNGHLYIGSSSHLSHRRKAHFSHLRRGIHHSSYLQHAYDKYGKEVFKFSILLLCEPFELMRYEQSLIDVMHPEYNINLVAETNLGSKRSPEFCAKISAIHKGKIVSEETRKKLSDSRKGKPTTLGMTGRVTSEETKLKISNALKGRIMSEETRKKMSIAQKGRAHTNINGMLGRHHSEEAKLKMSLSQTAYQENKREQKIGENIV